MAILEALSVGKSFGGLSALRDCTVQIAEGAITGIIGPNGAGKTTLLNVIAGVYTPDQGKVLYRGSDISQVPPHMRAALGLLRTFQISRELQSLTVLENMLVAAPNQLGESVWRVFLKAPAVAAEQQRNIARARELLEKVGLWGLADHPAQGLSGGQKKLLELARAMMLAPKVILLDEPAAGVSPPMVKQLAEIIRMFSREGMTFALVEHDMELVSALCDTVYVLAEGTNLTTGSFAQVTSDPQVLTAYLGRAG